MILRPPRSTLSSSSAASDVYKRQGRNRSLLLQHQPLALPLAPGVDVPAVRRGRLGDRALPSRKFARRHRTREHEALEVQASRQLENVLRPLDVRPPVLRPVLARVVVVRRQVEEDPGPPRGSDLAERPRETVEVADVHLHPCDVRMDGRATLALGATSDREDPVLVLEVLEEVPPNEAGCAGYDQRRPGHVKTTSRLLRQPPVIADFPSSSSKNSCLLYTS